MYKYVNIKGIVEKVEVGQSTYENYVQKGYKFYSSREEALLSRASELPFKTKLDSFSFKSGISNSDRSKFN